MGSMEMFILLAIILLLYWSIWLEHACWHHHITNCVKGISWSLWLGYWWGLLGAFCRCLSREKREINIILLRRYFSRQGEIIRLPELPGAFGSQQSWTDWSPGEHPTLIPAGFSTDRILSPPCSLGTFCHISCIALHEKETVVILLSLKVTVKAQGRMFCSICLFISVNNYYWTCNKIEK